MKGGLPAAFLIYPSVTSSKCALSFKFKCVVSVEIGFPKKPPTSIQLALAAVPFVLSLSLLPGTLSLTLSTRPTVAIMANAFSLTLPFPIQSVSQSASVVVVLGNCESRWWGKLMVLVKLLKVSM